jgi:hypothetical protein
LLTKIRNFLKKAAAYFQERVIRMLNPIIRGWMYLVALFDWHPRYVVSRELDQTPEIPFVLAYVDRDFEIALPAIFNSDQERLVSRSLRSSGETSLSGKGILEAFKKTSSSFRALKPGPPGRPSGRSLRQA